MLVFSEFARTPLINASGGRDHHISRSCAADRRGHQAQHGVRQERRHRHGAGPGRPATGAADPNGLNILPEDVIATVLASAKLDYASPGPTPLTRAAGLNRMSPHPRSAGRPLAALVLAAACGCGAPSEKVVPGTTPAITVTAQAASATPGFADQGGDALLISNGALARVRLDGSLGPLESHPGNPQPPGEARAVYPLGPHLALLVAANGLYLVQGGWMLVAPWGAQLPPPPACAAPPTRATVTRGSPTTPGCSG